MIVLQVALALVAGGLGAVAARRSVRRATLLCGVALALILFKVTLGYIPAAEPRLLPWDWYAHVDSWWYEVPAFFLLGAGLVVARRSIWKRDAILVVGGLLAVRMGWFQWETRGDLSSLRGRVDSTGVCRQTSGYSCAPAAAAALLHHHGVAADEREMAELCLTRPGIGGSSDCGIMRGLRRKLGDGWEVRISAPSIDGIATPSLVMVELTWLVGHCILVERVEPDRVLVNDPLAGRYSETRESFERRWLGQAIRIGRRL
jgi:hypothetical protein